jgi:prevent-host-death family protein
MTIVEVFMRTMAAGKFKATCLAVMDEVQAKREPVLVTKNGKPVAKLVPVDLPVEKDPLDAFYFGKIEIVGDIVAPIYSDEEWEEFFQESVDELK